MNAHELLAVYDAEMRVHPPFSRVRVVEEPGLTCVVDDLPGVHGGWVTYTRLDTRNAQRAIRSKVDFFRARDRSFEWTVFDQDTPSDLKQRLRQHGFESEAPKALLALDLDAEPNIGGAVTDADVRIVADPAWIDTIMDVQRAVWHEDFSELAAELYRDLQADPAHLSAYLAYADGLPASTGWTWFFDGSRFARLNGGCTLPAFRGRGLYTALVSVRAQEARLRRVRFLVVDANQHSRPILEKMGFHFLTYSQPFVWKPGKVGRGADDRGVRRPRAMQA